jgi:4'-phosphopantetheinyl transferase EntD
MRTTALVLLTLSLAAVAVAQDHPRIPLWPDGAAGSVARRHEVEQAQD